MYYNKNLSYPVPISETWDIQDGSKIKAYMECPRKYFYEYVLGWRSVNPSIHLIFGSAWHEAMAFMYENGFTTEIIQESYHKHFLPYFRQYFDPGDDEIYHPKTPARALLALIYYAGIYHNDLIENEVLKYDGKKLIEIGGKINLSNEYSVCFRQDTIMRNSRGVFSLEHKTGSSSYMWETQWELLPSTAIYTHVLYCLFPAEDVSGIKYNGIFFKKTKDDPKKDEKDPFRHFDKKRVPIFKSPNQMGDMIVDLIYKLDSIKLDFDALAESSDTDTYLPCFEKRAISCTNWGRVCEYHDFCLNWRNPLRHIGRIPIDMKVEFWNPLDEPVKVEVNL